MRRKRVVAYREDFQEMYFTKDNFLIPYYIAKALNENLTYYYSTNTGNTELKSCYRGAEFIQSKFSNRALSMLFYIVMHAWDIDVLFLNGSSMIHMIVVYLYKILNRKGSVVVFGDMERPQAEYLNETDFECVHGVKRFIKRPLVDFFMNNSTYIVANTEAYNVMKILCDRKGWKGLLHFYPCFDDELFNGYGLKRRTLAEKDNIIVVVGRIGNYQKNSEMIIDALKRVNLKDWKIYMIGPVTSSFNLNDKGNFQEKADVFFADYPQFKDKLIFTGVIYDQKELLDYYNRAKVFLSTARHEGFANVYSQAAALGCYVISTDVGGADVASNKWHYGTKLEQENAEELASVLQALVDDKIMIDEACSCSFCEMSYSDRIINVLLPKMEVSPLSKS